MIKKVLNLAGKILVYIYVFYLVVCLVIIPVLAPWIASSQASKILKHKVKVGSVFFNPFLWSLSVGKFSILDADQSVMAGFDKFTVDISFIKLLVKEYRIERLELNGLLVNASLLPDGKINLMALVPEQAASATPAEPAADPAKTEEAPATGAAAVQNEEPLPNVLVSKIALHKGTIRFTDQSVTPNFVAVLDQMEFSGTNISTDPALQAKTTFSARLNEKGIIKNEATLRPLAQPLELETSFSLNSYAMTVLTPYVGKYTGRGVKDGVFDFKMDYRIGNNKLTASHKVLVQRFDFGDKVESKDALPLPFGLALALLEDPQGRINISLPVTGDMNDPEFHYFHLIGQVARNFFVKLLTKPFAFLASAVGVGGGSSTEEDMGNIRFAPGRYVISDEEKTKLAAIITALKDRPRVSLEVKGSYDPEIDWKAIKAEVFDKDYKNLREESKREELEVYKQLYQRRFGIKELWTLARKFRLPDGKNYDVEKFTAEIKRQLIHEGSADQVALEVLAQERAQAVSQFLLQNGFDAKRLSSGAPRKTQGTSESVPLELVLNVFDGSTPAADAAPESAQAPVGP